MKIVKTGGIFLITATCIIGAIFCEKNAIPIGSMIGNLIAGALIQPLFNSFVDLTDNENWKTSQRKLKRAGILQKETIIRISFAYLFRIKVDGKYFLVKNSRSGKYQPVGGAYKFYKEEADYLRDSIPVENDDRIPVDKITKRDYRLLVKNKLLRKFVRRFNKTSYREQITDLSREFVEEIFFTGILTKETFGKLSYNYCGRHMTNVGFGNVFKIYELLLADVVEVQLSDEQEELFRKLMDKDSDEYHFATASEIEALGVEYGTNNLADTIANHTPKILSENTGELINRNKYKQIIEIDSKNMYSKK
ncbi:hypothetical protein IGJ02_003155 [Enterococcus sp. DIV0724b]|uniref:SMODS-associated NUDIX domain-containing protein n=1 Tax=Enterococcus sp. DIV0724b TaxID=2774694 RepID=UPI003D2FC3A9